MGAEIKEWNTAAALDSAAALEAWAAAHPDGPQLGTDAAWRCVACTYENPSHSAFRHHTPEHDSKCKSHLQVLGTNDYDSDCRDQEKFLPAEVQHKCVL